MAGGDVLLHGLFHLGGEDAGSLGLGLELLGRLFRGSVGLSHRVGYGPSVGWEGTGIL